MLQDLPSTENFRQNVFQRTAEFLMIPAFFFLPIQAAPVNTLIVLAVLFLLLSKNIKSRLVLAWTHPLSKAFLFFFLTAAVSIFWTENLAQGIYLLGKYIPYVIFPFILLIINPNLQKYYISAFFIGITISEILSYSMWLGITDMGKTQDDPNLWDHTPFIGHVLYSPIVAFAAFIMLTRLTFDWRTLKTWQRTVLFLFSITIITNLFFTHGRTGMIALLCLVFVLFIIKFPTNKVKAIFISSTIIIAIPTLAYYMINDFKIRVDVGKNDFVKLIEEQDAETSLGHRIINWHASIQMIEQQPILGVGIGDYAEEYEKIMHNQEIKYWPSENPHNQYLFSAATSGILGIISLLGIFITKAWLIYRDYQSQTNNPSNPLKIGLLVLFLIICLAESYLWRSNTTLLLILFSALFYKPVIQKS
ncbi:O-antigen biosynthesis protein [Thiosulfatimonas sediminis]|uniref:O-antigen biosynthesis protein n=1 Tax=Thiosulfatimonas sediminis TaxID=2675054 RepID=A0A6F8PX97_9GAMM|nr:O-antigen ligase family protein [Thiosulfatimonas sediminis]BBP46618.1 O-antigen biosynthesis protein [Thiosulfatimonas sediminis]